MVLSNVRIPINRKVQDGKHLIVIRQTDINIEAKSKDMIMGWVNKKHQLHNIGSHEKAIKELLISHLTYNINNIIIIIII